MMNIRTASIFAAAALFAGTAVPAFAARDESKPAATETAKKEQRYCVDGQATTGSILKAPRVCKTRAAWIAATGIDPATVARK
ncbi:hypothetical protein ACG3SL_10850 [Sphingomonas sp. CJ20]